MDFVIQEIFNKKELTMDLINPTDQGTVGITSTTVGEHGTSMNFEGDIGQYGRVFVTVNLIAGDVDKHKGTLEGNARALLEDGSLLSSPLKGSFRREGSKLHLFWADNVSNGAQNFVVWEVDILTKTGTAKAYSLL